MRGITKAAAEDVIERFSLGAANRLLAGYWLSLWQGDDPPRYERFNSAGLSDLVPNLMLFDVLPERHVTIRKAGIDLCRILNEDLDGTDWVKRAPMRSHRLYMRNFSTVARGAAIIGRRRISMASGGPRFNEELVLPFAPRADGTCPVIGHVDWKMDYRLRFRAIIAMENIADDRILPFRKKASGDL
ncbi:MAG TPA: PAS domain-containing protein [Rhizomicrobium sp.]